MHEMTFEVALPKGYRTANIHTGVVKLIEDWIVTVKENYRVIDRLPIGAARIKYG